MPQLSTDSQQKSHGPGDVRAQFDRALGRLARLSLIAVLFLWPLAAAPLLHAEAFRLMPHLTLRAEYNDNIFFSSSQEENDWLSTISPGILVSDQTERLESEVYGRLDLLYYRDQRDLDSVDGEAFGRLNYRVSPRAGVSTRAGYAKTSRPDRDILETGLVQSAESRDRYQFDFEGSYRLTEILDGSLRYEFSQLDYRDEVSTDSTLHSVQFGLIWDADRRLPNTDTRFYLRYANGRYDTSRVDSFSAILGAEWDYSEIWSVAADAGIRYTQTEFDVLKIDSAGFFIDEETSDLWSGIGVLALIYNGAYTRWNLSARNDVRNAPGRGGTTLRTELTGSLQHRFGEKVSGTFRAGYYINQTEEGLVAVEEVDERTLRVRPGIRIEAATDLFLEFAYQYTRVEDDIADETRTQHTVFGELYWRVPLLE